LNITEDTSEVDKTEKGEEQYEILIKLSIKKKSIGSSREI